MSSYGHIFSDGIEVDDLADVLIPGRHGCRKGSVLRGLVVCEYNAR
jgi:hypothetical protein